MDNEPPAKSPVEQAIKAARDEVLPPADEHISLSVVTMALVVELEEVSLAAPVSEVVDRVREEAAIPASATVILRSGGREPRVLSLEQSLREAGVESGDRLVLTPSATWGSGWQEVALFLGTSASAGVVGGAAYDLLRSTLRTMTARWLKHRGPSSTPLLDRYEALRIAQACLSGSVGIEDPRKLTAVSIRPDAAITKEAVTWIVTFNLPDRWVEAKVSVPAEGPEHAIILLNHHPL